MGLIREPLNVDFFVEPNMLTNEEKKQISEYIRNYKPEKKDDKRRKRLSVGKKVA